MDRSKAPYKAQDYQYNASIMAEMEKLNKRGRSKSGVRKKVYAVNDKSGRSVTSWSVPDWDYKKPGLPTSARGLFTYHKGGDVEIVCRGYDKFFNVGEIRKTEWANVEANTRGPYELSVKENGCIIFIGALDDETLLVTSKHSTGPRNDGSANHALAGESWLDRQLSTLGKTRADFARTLRRMNATAVAELCDDEFEEHVLKYAPEDAGLYLHGLNLNIPEFATYPGNLVDVFADEWGFRKVQYVMEDDVHVVKKFLDQVAETGNYAGRDTEGFVIRCQARDGPDQPWHDWFFKYKFEEPYLMYRQWREVTKAVIAGKLPQIRKHKKITEEYILYARRQLQKDPRIGRDFTQNHGIIAMRDGFLQEKGVKGSDIIRDEELHGDVAASNTTRDVVLVPVATIGCGKTTLALSLSKMFDWGHQQNDNIQGKGRRPQRFAQAVITSMQGYPVVIADRNNHQKREREQIMTDVQQIVPKAKFVALHYVHDRTNYDTIREKMRSRVLSRGDNHQTIQAGTKGPAEIIEIMEGFMHRFEPVNTEKAPDDGFSLVIDLDVAADSRENLQTVVEKLHEEYPKLFRMPTELEMDQAVEWALNDYRPDIKHDLSNKKNKNDKRGQQYQEASVQTPKAPKKLEVEYFGIKLHSSRISAIVEAVFSNKDTDTARFYKQLKNTRRVQTSFHVTLMHRASISEDPEYWAKLLELWQKKQDENKAPDGQPIVNPDLLIGEANVQLERVVWDDRIMAILVRLPDAGRDPDFHSVNKFAHITIGTAADNIKPVESNTLLERWTAGTDPKIRDTLVTGHVVLEGKVQGVLRR